MQKNPKTNGINHRGSQKFSLGGGGGGGGGGKQEIIRDLLNLLAFLCVR